MLDRPPCEILVEPDTPLAPPDVLYATPDQPEGALDPCRRPWTTGQASSAGARSFIQGNYLLKGKYLLFCIIKLNLYLQIKFQ